jgi:hypothetical protein
VTCVSDSKWWEKALHALTDGVLLCCERRLYYHFRPRCWYWVFVIIGRKFMIAMTALLFNKNPAFQMAIALLVLFIAYALQVRHVPYMSMSEREQVIADHRRAALEGDTLQQALAAAISQGRRRGKRVTTSVTMDKNSRRRQVAVSFFWNYNTVESVLLFSAVLVNLAGVMFESGRFDSGLYEKQKQFLTWAVVLVITVSVIYFGIVLVSEVYTMLTANAAWRHARESGKPVGARKSTALLGLDLSKNDHVIDASNPMFRVGSRSGNDGNTTVDEQSLTQMLQLESLPSSAQWQVVRLGYMDLLTQSQVTCRLSLLLIVLSELS